MAALHMMPLSSVPPSEAMAPSAGTAPSLSIAAPSGDVNEPSGTVMDTGVLVTVEELQAAVTRRRTPSEIRFIESSLLQPTDAHPRRRFGVDREGEIELRLPRRRIDGEVFH